MVSAEELLPLNGMLVVQDDAKREKIGSIILADSVEGDRMITGTVLMSSYYMLQDGTYVKPEVKRGDRVFYGFHSGAGNTWTESGITYRVLRHNELLAKVK
jgi:co-chaperonin GroES (HSP10)